jgi:hypothetical protein
MTEHHIRIDIALFRKRKPTGDNASQLWLPDRNLLTRLSKRTGDPNDGQPTGGDINSITSLVSTHRMHNFS